VKTETSEQVRQFYDQIGWQEISKGAYQNARYEDLRPVSQEYIRRCHLRVNRFLRDTGRFLLDAGSGPVQYSEYLTYSQGYAKRVCLDISFVALQEARKRIGEHGLFVVADVSRMPFSQEAFDGVVSLHTLHHLPVEDQLKAYQEIDRVLSPGSSAVVVNGWTDSVLMRRMNWLVRGMEWLGKQISSMREKEQTNPETLGDSKAKKDSPTGTFTRKMDAQSLKMELAGKVAFEIFCWRSVSVRFLRAVVHNLLGGRIWLRLLYNLEERFPHYFGEKGQYPLIVVGRPIKE
jgi:ubiquinone/menaquinone biosynthesis C-methylase UbiE